MAEMTSKRAADLLRCSTEYKGKWCCVLLEEDAEAIAAIIEQQAAEIARKDRMLNRAAEVIADKCTFICTANVKPQGYCKKCKLERLEKEAQGVE